MTRKFLIFSAASGFISVALGAFGAHALKEKLSPELLQIFETAVRYQFYHTLAIPGAVLLYEKYGLRAFHTSCYLFLSGILLFSGSLYILSLSGIKMMGAVTPFGGLCFLSGWLCLLFGALKIKS